MLREASTNSSFDSVLTSYQNKTLSDPTDAVLSLQGIGWLTRKAIGAATITQHLTQTEVTEDGKAVTSINIEQFGTGGLKGSTETRITDWKLRGHSDWLFGTVEGQSRYNTLKAVTEESTGKELIEEDAKFLVEGWLPETQEGEVVESYVDNEGNKWTAWQLWGFAEIDGKRMFTRRFAVRRKNKNEVVKVRLVYDYQGEL